MNTTMVRARSLEELEAVIARGMAAVVEVGEALMEVRARALYTKQGYPTFEAYWEGRWKMHRARAYQMIDAAKTMRALVSTRVDIPRPIYETQTRELKPILSAEPAAVGEVWTAAVEEAGDR
jgi:hypothetical protein